MKPEKRKPVNAARAAIYAIAFLFTAVITIVAAVVIAANISRTRDQSDPTDPPSPALPNITFAPAPAAEPDKTGVSGDIGAGHSPAQPDEQDETDETDISETPPPETPAAEGNDPQETDTEPPAETDEQHDETQAAIDRIAQGYGAVGVQVAVIRNGVITDTYNYGDATRGVRPMTDDIKIRTASVSKVVLAMLVMRLVEEGQLDIDEDISVYWGVPVRNPNYAGTPITIRQLLSHTSSIHAYGYGFTADEELVRGRFEESSGFERSTPGAMGSWVYNNYGFAVLGLTVEIATGETVNSLAARYLFEPLGIDAAFGSGSIDGTDDLATLYTNGGGVGRSVERQLDTLGSTFPGERGEEFPGGLTISASDLAKLVAALANGGEYDGIRVLSPESAELMRESQGRAGGFNQCLPLRRQANIYGENELYYHTGNNYGVFNLISFNSVAGDGVVVLTSGASGARDQYGIYSVCGEISEYIYRQTRR